MIGVYVRKGQNVSRLIAFVVGVLSMDVKIIEWKCVGATIELAVFIFINCIKINSSICNGFFEI